MRTARGMANGIRVAGLMLAAVAVGSCFGDNLPFAPKTESARPEGGSLAVTCEANVRTERLSCGAQGSSSPQLSEGSAAIIVGGQNIFVTLTSSNVTTTGNTFLADVTIKNLIHQPMGTPDNVSFTNVDIFFHTGPTNGVTVKNPDGTGTFTAANQPFFAYQPNINFAGGVNNSLEPDETSTSKNWKFNIVDLTGSTFQFTVLVSADVPFLNGFVTLDQDPGLVEAGGTTTLTATARDVVGRPVAGRTLTWTSTTPAVLTIGASTGIATAVGGNHQTGTVQIASDGPEATGTGDVRIYELLSARTPITTAAVTGSERLYKFVVPGGVTVLAMSVDSTATTTSGDADLYVRFGAPPVSVAAGPWDCQSVSPNSRESCLIDTPTAGDWFITVDTFSGFTDAELNADFTTSPAGYDIDVVFVDNGLNAAQQRAVADAVSKWETVVVGDLQPLALMLLECGGERINVVADDLYVTVATAVGDGLNGVLAFAGPCFIRALAAAQDPGLSIVGSITIDSDDLAGAGFLADTLVLKAVVVHELGHVIGIGTLWPSTIFGLLSGENTPDPTFNGPLAIAAYETVGGPAATELPVEVTIEGHWREDPFDTELMTPFINGATDALSLVSAQSLADEGYTVDTTAVDAYTLPGAMIVLEGGQVNRGVPYGNDILKGPIYALEPNGEFVRVR